MACIITSAGGNFTAPTGQQFTVDLTPPAGGGIGFLHVIYAGSDPVKASPYTFTAKSGLQNLHVFYGPDTAAQQGQTFTLVEVGGAANQNLETAKCDLSDPHFAIQIEGV